MNSSAKSRLRSLAIVSVMALSACAKLTPDPNAAGGTGGTSGGSTSTSVTLSVLAGNIHGSGYLDGPAAIALLGLSAGLGVSGVVTDASGNVFFSDTANHVVRKVSTAGVVSTLAGSGLPGLTDGTGDVAAFRNPGGLAIDSAGNIYVADTGNYSIRKVTPAGVVTTLAGFDPALGVTPVSGYLDGVRSVARFIAPLSVALDNPDQVGSIYVVDQEISRRTVRRLAVVSGAVTTVSTYAGPYTLGGMIQPLPIAVGRLSPNQGALFVGDGQVVRKITSAQTMAPFAGSGTLGDTGSGDGTASAARFTAVAGLAFDASGNLFIADRDVSNIRRVDNAGTVTTVAGIAAVGAGYVDGSGTAAQFRYPTALAVDPSGNVIIADSSNAALRKLVPAAAASASVVSTVTGGPGVAGNADGTGSAASFLRPTAVAVDPGSVQADGSATVYIADTGNHTIRKITAAGVVTAIGTPGTSGSTNGAAASASFNEPSGLAVDASGNVYVADSGNHLIRRITPAGVVSTLAGDGTTGSLDGSGTGAKLWRPRHLAIDASGTLFVLDEGSQNLRKIVTTAGNSFASVTTLAPAQTAAPSPFDASMGLAVDTSGNAYVASANCIVWKVSAAGVVSDFAGTRLSCNENLDGTGTAALLSPVQSMAYDPSGALLLSTTTRMRRIATATAAVTTPYGTLIPAAAGLATAGSKTFYLSVNNGVAKVALP